MADPFALSDLPTVEQAVNMGVATGPAPTGPSGTGNLVTSALGSGFYGAGATLGSGAEALARATGFSGAADAAQAFAERQKATADTYARPDLENASFFTPSGFAYKTLQGLPMMAGIAGGAALGEAAAPILGIGAGAAALAGGALAAFPSAVGENIERARAEGQPVDQATAAKALALGVPLAAVQAALPVMGEGMIAGRIASRAAPKIFGSEALGGRAVGAAAGAAVQVPAGAAGEALMQQMGDPNRDFAQRSQDIMNAALAGGVQGAFFGGILHSVAKKPPADVSTDDLLRLTSDPLGLPASQTPQPPPPGAPGTEAQLQPPQRFAPEPNAPTPPPPGVVTPEAQPGQAIRQLTDQTAPVLPGVQPVSGEVIQGRELHQGEPVEPPGPPPGPALLGVDPTAEIPAKDRVSRPSSDDEALITPPPAGGDVTKMSGTELIDTLQAHGPSNEVGQRVIGELQERLKGEKITSADDIRQVLAQQDADKAKAKIADEQTQQIKKATRGFLPDFLKPHLGDEVALKGAIFDEVKARDEADEPFGSRLTAIAKDFGIVDEKGALVDPRAAQEQADTARATDEAAKADTTNLGPNPDVPSRVLRDAIPESHQPKWDALEALRKDAPQEFLPKIDELQSKLAAPKRGEAGQIVKATSDLRKAIEGQKAVDVVRGKPEPAAKSEPVVKPAVDETQGAKKFSEPVSPAKPPEAPAPALSKQDQLKAKQKGKVGAVQERSPAQVDVREQPEAGGPVRGGNAKEQVPAEKVEAPAGGKGAQEASAPKIAPEHETVIRKALKAVRDNIGALMNQKLPERTRMAKGKAIPENPQGYAKRTSAYDTALSGLDRAQAAVGKALKSGDARELAKIGDDHFPPTVYDEHYDDLPRAGQKLLDEHVQKVDDLLEAIKEATGKNHTLTGDQAFSSREPTAHDQVLASMVDRGMSARQMLEHIARNGSNSIRRTMAAKLLQTSKADPYVRFGTMDEMAKDHPTQRNVYGDYHDSLDRVRIFDKADMEHTLLHEFAHAATVRAIEGKPEIRAKADELHKLAKSQMTPEEAAHPSMANSAEMVAEAMANPDFANLLDGMKGPGKQTLWQSIKDFVRQIFGLPKGSESLLDHVESLAGEAADATNHASTAAGMERATGLYARSGLDMAENLGRYLDHKFDLHGINSTIFRMSLLWRKAEGLAASVARWLPSSMRHVQNDVELRNRTESLHGLTTRAHNAERALDKKGVDLLNDLRLADVKKIDPRVPVDKHTWLNADQKKALGPEIERLNRQWGLANRGDKAVAKAYELQNNVNRVNQMSAQVAQGRRVIERSGINIKLNEDALARFSRDTTGMKDDPRRAEKFFSDEFRTMRDAVREALGHVNEKLRTTTDPEKIAEIKASVSDLRSWERDATRSVASLSQQPNFPVRRQGTQHVSFELAPKFGAAEAKRLRDKLAAKGFTDIIDHNIDNNSAYIRTANVSSMNDMISVLKEAQKEGLITKIKSFGPASALAREPGVLPSHLTSEIKAFRDAFPLMDTSGPDSARAKAYNDAVKAQLDELQQSLIDNLPETNASKIFARRENVQGMSSDMGRAFLERSTNTNRLVAQTSMADAMNAARKGLRDEVKAAQRDPNMSPSMTDKIHAAANEFMLRDAQKQFRYEHSPFDTLRRTTHFFELSLSVPYALALHTQSWTLGLGELTKHFGGLQSAREMAKAQVLAMRVMKAAFSSDSPLAKDLMKAGSDRWAFILTPEKLAKAGFTPDEIKDILTLNNMGAFNTSKTQWANDGLHHHEGVLRQLHDVSSAWTLYSEMMPRLAQGFAALKLYREREAQGKAPIGKEWSNAHEFALHQINSSQFTWGDQPRAFGKQGVAGQASPLVAQFQGFRAALLEKMHREFSDAFLGARTEWKPATEAEFKAHKYANMRNDNGVYSYKDTTYRDQARKFLLTHIAAQTMLAGTMGLPFVGMFAGIYDRLADWATGDHTHDIRASYRGWLSNVFGDGVGEVLAHGVPRLGGVDLSTHLGEDRLLPFTDLALSKKKLEDEVKDQAFKMTGSAAHLVTNLLLGARDFTNGDFLEGSAKVMPEMFRNLAEGTLINKYGFTDKAGFGLPGEKATTKDVVAKMLGFTPSDEANYSEKARIASDIRERQEFDANNIQTHLAKAFNRQDPAAYAAWMNENNQFMASHPGEMPPIGTFATYLKEHMQSAALAGALGTPLGVNPRDFLTRGMVGYGNLGDQ